MNERDLRYALELMDEYKKIKKTIQAKYPPVVKIYGGSDWDVSLGEFSAKHNEDSGLAVQLRHLLKNAVYDRLQEVEAELKGLGIDLPKVEPDSTGVVSQIVYTDWNGKPRAPKRNWLSE